MTAGFQRGDLTTSRRARRWGRRPSRSTARPTRREQGACILFSLEMGHQIPTNMLAATGDRRESHPARHDYF
jgi:hypothetical protein